MTNSTPYESVEQSTLVAWFDRTHRALKGRLFAIPNGGKRHRATATQLRREGVRAGVPDLMLPVARRGYHGLFIEMKRVRGSQTSKEQKDWHVFLREQGYRVEVCKGHQIAMAVINEYLAEEFS